jgi:hypothetical protein
VQVLAVQARVQGLVLVVLPLLLLLPFLPLLLLLPLLPFLSFL